MKECEISKKGVALIIFVYLLIFLTLSISFLPEKAIASAEENKFSIIILPDTQKYPKSYPEIFTNQAQWIVDNKEKLNIQFVIHEGDIVAKENKSVQWERANSSMSILDENNIPYSVTPGNNDHKKKTWDTINYNSYFPVSRFEKEEWWGGNYNENDNSYQLLTIQGKDYIFLSLDFCPTSDEISWADNILNSYSERSAILTTHGYLGGSAQRSVADCGSTEYIWQFAKKHKNLQLVLCGHTPGESRRTDLNDAGKQVNQILANYQTQTNGGNGWLRILEFSPSENKIYVKTYSPYINSYKTDLKSQFVLEY